MESATFSDLIGAGRDRIQWGRPMMFAAALFVAESLFHIPYYLIMDLVSGHDMSVRHIPLPHPPQLIDNLLSNLVLAFLILLAVRLIRIELVAVFAAAIVYAPVGAIITYLTWALDSLATKAPVIDSMLRFSWIWNLVINCFYVLFFIGSIVLAMRLIKKTWLAVVLGAIVGRFLFRIVLLIYSAMMSGSFSFTSEVSSLASALLPSIVFPAVLLFGLWLSADNAKQDHPRIDKDLYVGIFLSTAIFIVTSADLAVVGVYAEIWPKETLIVALVLMAFLGPVAVVHAIFYLMMIYKMWAAIQDGHARTTPARAVGFLFIPIFSLYWLFQVLPGFATDFNAFKERHNLPVNSLSPGILTAFCIILLGSIVCWFVGDILIAIVGAIMVSRICDAVNSLPAKTLGSVSDV